MKLFKFSKWSLFMKFGFALSVEIVIIFSFFSYMVIRQERANITKEMDQSMINELHSLENFINITENNIQDEVNTALNTAYFVFSHSGSLQQTNRLLSFTTVNQITKQTKTVKLKQWLLNNHQVQYNYDIVDKIQSLTGQTATIFQRFPEGFLRISTNLKKKNGERAVGTYIPNQSPVIKTILKGQIYRGKAWVVNAWYNTAYMPIYMGRKIVGILYVGIKQKDLDILKNFFKDRKYLVSGYPTVVDTSGTFIIHPKLNGVNIKNYDIFKKVNQYRNDTVNVHRFEYMWPEKAKNQRKKILYQKYIKKLKAHLIITYYEDEIFHSINQTRNIILIFSILSIIISIIITSLILKQIINRIEETQKFVETITSGDLRNELEIKNEDEISSLLESLNKTSSSIKGFMVNLEEQVNSLNDTSETLIDSGEQIAEGSQQQAAALEEFTSNLEQIRNSIVQNNNETQKTSKEAEIAGKKIKQVSLSIGQANEAMMNIFEKIKIVSDIAEKTDILAINASIEASRASDSGKGFSVIAKEIRELAEKSQKAAINILSAVSLGMEMENKAKIEQENALPAMINTIELMKNISKRSENIEETTSQITNSISELNSVSQKSAAQAVKLRDAAELLALQAEELASKMAFWKI